MHGATSVLRASSPVLEVRSMQRAMEEGNPIMESKPEATHSQSDFLTTLLPPRPPFFAPDTGLAPSPPFLRAPPEEVSEPLRLTGLLSSSSFHDHSSLSFGDFDPGDAITGEVTTGELSPGARSGLCELEDWSSLPYWLLEIEVYCDDRLTSILAKAPARPPPSSSPPPPPPPLLLLLLL
mmetsp:Transcript_108464/g.183739  ORF Transcript_108464/g.183739 Transcript_108464/m.183739 type:complete len:180 (-) Transcript_108464:738-1277(-)